VGVGGGVTVWTGGLVAPPGVGVPVWTGGVVGLLDVATVVLLVSLDGAG